MPTSLGAGRSSGSASPPPPARGPRLTSGDCPSTRPRAQRSIAREDPHSTSAGRPALSRRGRFPVAKAWIGLEHVVLGKRPESAAQQSSMGGHMGAKTTARNVALVGASGAGKTTLLESMLFVAGAIGRKGSVADGTTVGDSSAEARAPTDEHRGQRCAPRRPWARLHRSRLPGLGRVRPGRVRAPCSAATPPWSWSSRCSSA